MSNCNGLPRGKVGSQVISEMLPTDGTPVNAVAAQGVLTVGAQVTAEDTMTIDSTVYTFKANGTTPLAEGDIEMGSDVAGTRTAIVAAINGSDTQNDAHPTVTASAFATADCTLTANTKGVVGNSIATTETFNSASNEFDATTLGTATAGVDGTEAVRGGVMYVDNSYLYIALDKNTVADANWRRVSLGTAY